MTTNAGRPIGITIVAVLMIIFGLAEIATGFTHNFLGLISTAEATASTYGAAVIGGLYTIGGVFLWSMKKVGGDNRRNMPYCRCAWAHLFSRGWLVPRQFFSPNFSIIIGTAIAVIFAIYIGIKWKSFT